MHKGVLILTRASDKYEALENVNDFLEQYGDGDVFDWKSVGGRWMGTLAPAYEKFQKWSEKLLKQKGSDFISSTDINKNKDKLQAKWEKMGMEGPNPYADHYKLPPEGTPYDVMPLKDCIETVKKWCRNMDLVKEESWKEMLDAKEKDKEEGARQITMSGYYAGKYKDAEYGSFCFESNVYNATDSVGEVIPDEVESYWVITIDMHN